MTKKVSMRIGAWVMTAIPFVIAWGIEFDPDCRAVQAKAFGEHPLGLPIGLFAGLLSTVVLAPEAFVMPHLFWVVAGRQQTGRTTGLLGLLWGLVRPHPDDDPQLRRSHWIIVGGLLYFVAVTVVWIAYTDRLGI